MDTVAAMESVGDRHKFNQYLHYGVWVVAWEREHVDSVHWEKVDREKKWEEDEESMTAEEEESRQDIIDEDTVLGLASDSYEGSTVKSAMKELMDHEYDHLWLR